MPRQELIALLFTILGVGIFAILFVFLYSKFVKIQVSEVESGKQDVELVTNILKAKNTNKDNAKRNKIIKWVIYGVLLVILVPLFIIAIVNIANNNVMVVASGSMSYKNEVNDYLIENNLNDQFNTYDIIFLRKVNEGDLELYDTVAYFNGEENIIHRIVSINADGSFITRGDANTSSDPYLVTYDDIIGQYTGNRIPGLGIFVLFIQAPAGWATIICLLFCLFIIDFFSNKVVKAQKERMEVLTPLLEVNEEVNYNEEEIKTKLYYQGIEYRFSKDKYLGQTLITDEEVKESSSEKIVKNIKKK